MPISAAVRMKRSAAVGEHHVGVGHKHHGNVDILTQLAHHVENLVSGHARLQRTHVGLLDDRAFSGRVGERDTQLDEVRARV